MTDAPSQNLDLAAAVSACLALRGAPKSAGTIRATLPPGVVDADALVRGLASLSIAARWADGSESLPADVFPAVALFADGRAAVTTGGDDLTGARLLLIAADFARDTRADSLVTDAERGWFWPTLWHYRRYYYEAAALSAVINVLGLAGIIFMMTVYDRILPNQAFVTLWSLAVGVGIAMVFEYVSRSIRGVVLDRAGKKIDLVLSDSVFARVLATRMEHRSSSSGAFANMLKEFEQVRSFVTSASLTAIADLPFALLFLIVIAMIAGPLAWVAVAAFTIVTVLSLAVQKPMARAANQALREGAIRHGTVIESLEGLETLKALRAEPRMRHLHEQASTAIAGSAMESQRLANMALNVTIFVQQLAAAGLLVWGVYLAAQGKVTGGALIAAVQLNSRALAPLVSIAGLATRLQQSLSALKGLNRIMALPVEREPGRSYLSIDQWQGTLEARDLGFGYTEDAPPVLEGINLRIAAGERVAVLGRMGSGKSTLLRLLASLYRPRTGQVLLDGVDLSTIEPADVRSAVMLVGQDARLFHGTLKENLRLGAPEASDGDLLRLAEATGVAAIAAAHPMGYERPVGERGDTLSGGQRQAVALTRALLARPKILLLDEPTAAMDQRSEAETLRALADLPRDTTIVVVTHRSSMLALASRIIVIEKGRVVADGPKADVLAALDKPVRSVA